MEELLKELGYTDDQIKAIIDGMTEKKIYTSAEEKIDERYGKLKNDHSNASQQLKEAQDLIKELQDKTKGNDDAQQQIADYQKQVQDAEARAAKAELEAEVKVQLLANGAAADDVDYLMYRIEQGDKAPEMKDGKLSGFDDVVADLKTKYPNQFDSNVSEGSKGGLEVLPGGKPGRTDNDKDPDPANLADALRQQYENKD